MFDIFPVARKTTIINIPLQESKELLTSSLQKKRTTLLIFSVGPRQKRTPKTLPHGKRDWGRRLSGGEGVGSQHLLYLEDSNNSGAMTER